MAFFLNLGFTIIEIVGGFWTNSIAVLSDALHDLGDSISLGLAWYFQRYSQKEGDNKFTYGYHRFSLLGALITTAVLIVGSLFILYHAAIRVLEPQEPIASGMLILAIIGITVNGAAYLRLRSGTSLSEKVVSWHLIEDVLGWVAVLIVAIVLMFYNVPILDPILSILITLWVLYNVMKNAKEAFFIFLQRAPDEVHVDAVAEKVLSVEGVASTHHVHVWSLDGERTILSAHAVVEPGLGDEGIARVKRLIKKALEPYHFDHMTIEIEFGPDDCMIPDRGKYE